MKRGTWRKATKKEVAQGLAIVKAFPPRRSVKISPDGKTATLRRWVIKPKGLRWIGRKKKRSVGIKTQRSPLKKRSPAKAKLHALYVAGLVFLLSLNPICRICEERKATEGHHPWGQRGWLILLFWPICRICHDWIEDHKNKARGLGLILYK
jgi:hypothetical protein